MGLFSAPKPPPPMPMPPPAAHPATLADSSVAMAGQAAKKAAAGAAGMGVEGTVATSPQGLKTSPSTANTTLLGG